MTHEVPPSLPPADAAAPRDGAPRSTPGAGPGPAGPPATAPASPGLCHRASHHIHRRLPGRDRPGGHRGSRRDRGRCRASRLGHGLLPGPGRGGRAGPGEGLLPAGKGLRRRPHPPRGEGPGRHGRSRRRAGRLGPEQGPADHRRRGPARASLAGTVELSRLRAGPEPPRLRRDPRPHGAEGGRAAPRRRDRDRARAGRDGRLRESRRRGRRPESPQAAPHLRPSRSAVTAPGWSLRRTGILPGCPWPWG